MNWLRLESIAVGTACWLFGLLMAAMYWQTRAPIFVALWGMAWAAALVSSWRAWGMTSERSWQEGVKAGVWYEQHPVLYRLLAIASVLVPLAAFLCRWLR